MGSPENKLGDDPVAGDLDSQFWLNIAGPNSTKISGDRYASKVCPTTVARCTKTADPNVDNDDYSKDGYFFTMNVKSVDPGKDLILQVFDGAQTYVGDHCEYGKFPDTGQRSYLAGLDGGTRFPLADEQFKGGETSWCTGDQKINGGWDTETTFIVREPDSTPWSVTDNPVVRLTGRCTPQTLPAYDGTINNRIFEMLDPYDGKYNSEGDTAPPYGTWTFASTFRRWATICSIPAGTVKTGEYMVQVRSNANPSDLEAYDPGVNGRGHNRMSLRAGFGPSGVSVARWFQRDHQRTDQTAHLRERQGRGHLVQPGSDSSRRCRADPEGHPVRHRRCDQGRYLEDPRAC